MMNLRDMLADNALKIGFFALVFTMLMIPGNAKAYYVCENVGYGSYCDSTFPFGICESTGHCQENCWQWEPPDGTRACYWDLHSAQNCGLDLMNCVCYYENGAFMGSCNNKCSGGNWYHNGNSVCTDTGPSCNYDIEICDDDGCCDGSCSSGCQLTPNDANCGFGGTCMGDCTCSYNPCNSYSDETSCESAGCYWCGCNGDKEASVPCVGSSGDCSYDTCSISCGAECEDDGDCSGSDTCDSNCNCDSVTTCPGSVCGGYCGDYGGYPDYRYYNLCGTNGDYSNCDANGDGNMGDAYPFCSSDCLYEDAEYCPGGCSGGSCSAFSGTSLYRSCWGDWSPRGGSTDQVYQGHVYLAYFYWSNCPNTISYDCTYLETGDDFFVSGFDDVPDWWDWCWQSHAFYTSYNSLYDSNDDGRVEVRCTSNGAGSINFRIYERPGDAFDVCDDGRSPCDKSISGGGSAGMKAWFTNTGRGSWYDPESIPARIEYYNCPSCTSISPGQTYTIPSGSGWNNHDFTLNFNGDDGWFGFRLYSRESESCWGPGSDIYLDSDSGHSITMLEICNDGVDNDGDSDVDCDDSDCLGEDTDGDGYVDCCDVNSDCSPNRNCVNENCVSHQCSYDTRGLCDDGECSLLGLEYHCDGTGTDCVTPDDDKGVCETCFSGHWDDSTGGLCCEYDWNPGDDWCHNGVVGNIGDSCVGGLWYDDHCTDFVSNCDEKSWNGTHCLDSINCGFGGDATCPVVTGGAQSVCGPCCDTCECIDIIVEPEKVSVKTGKETKVELKFNSIDSVNTRKVELYVKNQDQLDNCFGYGCGPWSFWFENSTGNYSPTAIISVPPLAFEDNIADFFFMPSGPTPTNLYEADIGVRNPDDSGDCNSGP